MAIDPLKIALVGCGQIADAHLQEVRKIDRQTGRARLVGVCDRHFDLARQAAARFDVPAAFDDVGRMLDQVRPDVVHVTTPPQTHRDLALRLLRAGIHVYIEKPFTVDAAEADEVLDAARAASRLVCVGHDQLFDPVWQECQRLHAAGELGRVVHVDSVQGYDLGGPFGALLAGEPDHWVRRLPGGLFQNVISHPLYKIADFLPDERPRVWATWFGTGPFPTEMRVLLQGAEVTGTLTFTSQARPLQRTTRILGTRGCVEVDFDACVVRTVHAARLPGALGKIEAPARQLRGALGSLAKNVRRFLRHEIQYFGGMNRLFTEFYAAIRGGTEPPISFAEIRRVTALMDDIFDACRRDAEDAPARAAAVSPVEIDLAPLAARRAAAAEFCTYPSSYLSNSVARPVVAGGGA